MLLKLFILSILQFQNSEFVVQERFRVDYVTLDVKAVDRDGNPVTDLTLDDFEIKEDREEVSPDFFEILDFRQDLRLGDLSFDKLEREQAIEKQVRQLIIAMDLENTKPKDALLAFAQMKDFLQALPTNVVYRINLYSLARGSISKGFVDTPTRALAYLEEFKARGLAKYDRHSTYRPEGSGLLEYGIPQQNSLQRSRQGGTSRLGGGTTDLEALEQALMQCKSLSGDRVANCMAATLDDFYQRQEDRTRQVLGGLESLTYKFEDNNDLKIMLFVSPGFNIKKLDSVQRLANHVMSGDAYSRMGGRGRPSSFQLAREFDRVLHACIKNRVIFNTFDIFNGKAGDHRFASRQYGGFSSGIDNIRHIYTIYSHEASASLGRLAEESGGRHFQSFHMKNPLERIINEDRFFYQIGYASPSSGKPGNFRKIKIKCKRRSVKLFYRKGYFGAS